MKAKITKQSYRCAPDGHTTVTVVLNELVYGKVAEMAIADKAAEVVKDNKPPETKPAKAIETKKKPKKKVD